MDGPGSPLFATNANYFRVTPAYLRVDADPVDSRAIDH